jgi:hypothetical protein
MEPGRKFLLEKEVHMGRREVIWLLIVVVLFIVWLVLVTPTGIPVPPVVH